MRPQRLYEPKRKFYALRAFKYAGVEYKRGDEFDTGEMPSRKRIQFFQNWYIGYSEDFRDNKSAIKEVSIEKEPEVKSEEVAEEKPKQTRRRRTKKTSEKTEENSSE